MIAEEERQQQAWSVYLEHQGVFASVLKSISPLQIADGMDLVHDFVIERLPQALASYDPDVGPIRPWLSVVFQRYARRRLAERASLQKRCLSLESLGGIILPQSDSDRTPSLEQQQSIEDAFKELPDESRSILFAYFGNGPESGNFRALARRFNLSRHRAQQSFFLALGSLAERLEGKGVLSREEIRICRAHLISGQSFAEIAECFGETEDEIRSLLRSALATLGAALSSASQQAASGSIQVDRERMKFHLLVQAIRSGDREALELLRADWEDIRSFVQAYPEEADRTERSSNHRAALILWLSTPLTPEPIAWAELTGVPSFVLEERQKLITQVDQLWRSWSSGRIVKQIKDSLSERKYEHAERWGKHAETYFAHMSPELIDPKLFGDSGARAQVCLDVVAGYGAYVDQLLAKPRRRSAEVRRAVVLGFERFERFEDTPILELHDRTRVSCKALGRAIEFRTSLGSSLASQLAYAISLSLPAHMTVLPTLDVEVDYSQCWLFPIPDETLAVFLQK